MEQVRSFTVLGCMSGTSLDGLDLALCRFEHRIGQTVSWRHEILAAHTVHYPLSLEDDLRNAHEFTGLNLLKLDRRFAAFLGEQAAAFLAMNDAGHSPDLLVSHGHTIYHAPHQGLTYQLGTPSVVAVHSGCRVLGDLRSADVALGGQGAPLVPMGDRFLFGDYAACVNLGGFANVSLERHGKRVAWDICPVNFVLNVLAVAAGSEHAYDDRGELAQQGEVIEPLLARLEALSHYHQPGPKSLGREWVEHEVIPLLKDQYDPLDLLRTWVEHVALRVSNDLGSVDGKVLFTGGGIHNDFLLERIAYHSDFDLVVANSLLADFKEALVFAFLGALWLNGDNNVLASVTGARCDHRAGVLCEASQNQGRG